MSTFRLARLALISSILVTASACGGGDRYAGMDAETLFRMAENEMAEGEYQNTIDTLERLIFSFGDWGRIADARFMMAEARFANEEYLTARADYQRFLDRHIGHEQSAAAALGQCRSLAALAPHPQRDQTYTEEAVTTCGNVVVDYARTPEADEAAQTRRQLRMTMAEKEYLNARHYFRRRQYDPAIIYFQFVVDLYPESEFAPLALQGIYEANTEIGYDDLAGEAKDRLLREYPESEAAVAVQAATEGSTS